MGRCFSGHMVIKEKLVDQCNYSVFHRVAIEVTPVCFPPIPPSWDRYILKESG
jgi:hypothetical protein